MTLRKDAEDSAKKTAQALMSGDVVIVPTDTVYGFSGIVNVKNSVLYNTDKKIREIKGREESKPFIHLIALPEDIFLYTDDIIPQNILSLWPGAITLVAHKKPGCPLVEESETVAFRCPGDAWLRSVIRLVGAPIYSTSANRSGKAVCSTEDELMAEFSNSVPLIVLDGDKNANIPSTIVAVEGGKVRVLRQGSVKVP